MAVALHQRHFRFGADDGTEATHTWRAAEDTAISISPGVPFLLRIAVWEEGVPSGSAANTVNQFQCRKNGGAWQNITTTSTICQAVAVNAFTNGANCTQRLTTKPTGAFETSGAGCTEDGNSGGNANDIAAGGYSETEAGLQLVSADLAQGDVVEFRLVCSPTPISVYDVIPGATASYPLQTLTQIDGISTTVALWPATVALMGVTPPSRLRVSYLAFEVPNAPVAQHGRPKSDHIKGTWTASVGTDLWAMLNEEAASDAEYIISASTPSSDTAVLVLTGLNRPQAGTCSVFVRTARG